MTTNNDQSEHQIAKTTSHNTPINRPFTRRAFLWSLSALPPAMGLLALGGQGLRALAATATPTATVTGIVPLSCVAMPAQTEGPYFVDEMLKRIDIRLDPSDNTTRPGALLNLKINVFTVSDSMCSPLKDVQVDIWHTDATGDYSDVGQTTGRKFLRGYQITDENGAVDFTTIYPGWYQGRTVHIHMMVRQFSETKQVTYQFTSQLYFDDSVTDAVYAATAPYNTRNNRDIRNVDDGIFTGAAGTDRDADDYGEQILVKLTKEIDGSYTGQFNVGIDMSQPSSTSGNMGGGARGGQPLSGTPPKRN